MEKSSESGLQSGAKPDVSKPCETTMQAATIQTVTRLADEAQAGFIAAEVTVCGNAGHVVPPVGRWSSLVAQANNSLCYRRSYIVMF